MREMMENEIFKVNDKLLIMNTFSINSNGKYFNLDYEIYYCPNCGKQIEVICD